MKKREALVRADIAKITIINEKRVLILQDLTEKLEHNAKIYEKQY